jgi:hypothetical protein
LCQVFPKLKCDYPKDTSGHLIPRKLDDEDLARFQGILGHYHIQSNKVDPGPAFQWEHVVQGARDWLPHPAPLDGQKAASRLMKKP